MKGSPRTFLFALLAVLLATTGRLVGDDSALSLALTPGGNPAMKGLVYRFFDEQTGQCTGQMRIARVAMEYRRQGFMHVAWRPLVVLAQVDLQFAAALAWPAQGSQIARQLLALGGRDELVMRDVHLHLAGSPEPDITALTARLLPGGTLELSDATRGAGGAGARPAGTLRLQLTGPQAGRLTHGGRPARADSILPSPRLSQSAP